MQGCVPAFMMFWLSLRVQGKPHLIRRYFGAICAVTRRQCFAADHMLLESFDRSGIQ